MPMTSKIRWEQIKRNEREQKRRGQLSPRRGSQDAAGIAPSLSSAGARLTSRLRLAHLVPVLGKLEEELQEFRDAMAACTAAAPAALPSAKEHLESELGDVLFTMVNISRFLKINPEEALEND